MPTLAEKLKNYENFELAFLLKYKGKEYTDETRNRIIVELAARGIGSESVLNKLIEEKEAEEVDTFMNTRCPRCTSDKIVIIRKENYQHRKTDFKGFSGQIEYEEKEQCAICGWDFQYQTEPGMDLFTSIRVKVFVGIGIVIIAVLIVVFLIGLF